MEKIARNDPCPCGSKMKYKHCCFTKKSRIPPLDCDREYVNLRRIEGEICEGAMQFAVEQWGKDIFDDGWDAFCLGEDLEMDSSDGDHLFPSWFIFRWIPYDYSEEWECLGKNTTLADLYVQKNPKKDYLDFLVAVSESHFSFFLIEEIIPSRRMVLKDLLLDRTITIKEKSGSLERFKGFITFARLISCKDQEMQISFSTIPLPTNYALDVLDLKEKILEQEKSLTPSTLFKYDNDLRKAYFAWSQSLFQLPELRNSDGDPFSLRTLTYELSCSPKEAFDQLVSLCKGEKPTEILEDGIIDEKGKLTSIEFPWFKSRSDKTIMGEMKIEGHELTINVNSMKRSKKIQKEIEKRLPNAKFIREDEEEFDLEELAQKEPSPRPEPTIEEREILQAFFKDHYKKWLDIPLPALKGKSPLQAAKNAEDRERLEFLLLDLEMNNQQKEDILQVDVDNLRNELGLPSKNHLIEV